MKKAILLFDVSDDIPFDNYQFHGGDEWVAERNINQALQSLGYEVIPVSLYNKIDPLLEVIKNNKISLVFNLCESFHNNRKLESNIAALIELFDIPYTGAKAENLRICGDKGLSKKLLKFHRIKSPDFLISRKKQPLKNLKRVEYPAIVKPINSEGSEGLSNASLVHNFQSAMERIDYVHNKLNDDAIIEEFVEGREIYCSCMGSHRIQVFPYRELFYKNSESGAGPKFFTFNAKWDDDYRKKWNIRSAPAQNISPELDLKIKIICKKIFKVFQLECYARLDFKINENNVPYVIEINPNPNIAKNDEFARSAERGGLEYEQLIKKIIDLSRSRKKIKS